MTEPDEIRLQRMGLSRLAAEDSFLDHEDDFDKKAEIHRFLEASESLGFDTKPKKPFFEIEENPGDKSYVACHLPIPVLVIITTVKKKTSLNKVENIPEKYTWAMEEAAEWCKLHLTFDEIKSKTFLIPLKVASDPEIYAISNYFEYIPTNVIDAEEKYKNLFLKKHENTHQGMTLNNIKVKYRIFKCNTALNTNQKVEYHFKKNSSPTKGTQFP